MRDGSSSDASGRPEEEEEGREKDIRAYGVHVSREAETCATIIVTPPRTDTPSKEQSRALLNGLASS